MARTVKDKRLDSREVRGKLPPRGKPYWRLIERGLHLGYRRLVGKSGTWWARHYLGHQQYEVQSLGAADDMSDADGIAILDFSQAQKRARDHMVTRAHAAAGKGPVTVAAAIERYLKALASEGKDTKDTRSRAEAMILPSLGEVDIASLTTERIRDWIEELVSKPPRARTAKGKPQRYRKMPAGRDGLRRRHSTANRLAAILKAALTHAYEEELVSSDEAWARVKPFKNATSARIQHLTVAEAQRLLNACAPDFRDLVRSALLTGCRYGELCALTVANFNPDTGTLAVLVSKSGKPRHVVLTDEGTSFFKQLCAGRAGDAVLLAKSSGKRWGPSHQIPLMVEACERAKIKPAIAFHGLRHTYASLTVMGGAPLMVVAENLGHVDTRMVQKHYGHMSKSYVADAIRAAAPRFGTEPSKLAVIR